MYVRVSVQPGAKREYCKVIGEARYEIAVRAPAQRNLANLRVQEILAEQLQIPLRQLRLVAGHQSQRKIYTLMSEV